MSESSVPPPGSSEAFALGCLCPQAKNRFGDGAFGVRGVPQYMVVDRCPLHTGDDAEDAEDWWPEPEEEPEP